MWTKAWNQPAAEAVTRRKVASLPAQVAGLQDSEAEAFSSLATVGEKRKKHMAWIKKEAPDKTEEALSHFARRLIHTYLYYNIL